MYIENFNSIKLIPLPKKKVDFSVLTEITKEKNMESYEHTIITKSDISESQSKKIIDKYENIIKENQGKIVKTENWGLRMLSHKIKNNKKGFYIHIKLEGDGKTVNQLEKEERIDDSLLRYLTIKVKKHDLDTIYFEKKQN